MNSRQLITSWVYARKDVRAALKQIKKKKAGGK